MGDGKGIEDGGWMWVWGEGPRGRNGKGGGWMIQGREGREGVSGRGCGGDGKI